MLLLCSHSPNDVPPEPQRNVSKAVPCVRPKNARGHKTFLCSNEHGILNAHKYENIMKFSIFQAQINLEGYFFCS